MQDNEKPQFVAILNGLAAIKPGAKLTPEAYAIWWDSMQGWPLEEFKAAANHLARTEEFFPNPFHFEKLRKAGRATAGEAWDHVLRYVRTGSYSGYNGPGRVEKPSADAERAVNAIGGYRIIAQSEESEHGHMLHRFTQNYDDIREASDVREAVPQIANPKVTELLTRMRA